MSVLLNLPFSPKAPYNGRNSGICLAAMGELVIETLSPERPQQRCNDAFFANHLEFGAKLSIQGKPSSFNTQQISRTLELQTPWGQGAGVTLEDGDSTLKVEFRVCHFFTSSKAPMLIPFTGTSSKSTKLVHGGTLRDASCTTSSRARGMGGSWVRGPPNSLPFDFTDGGWVDSHASVSGENKERALDALLDDAVLISGGHTGQFTCSCAASF
ncbi:hypothetical protein C8J56DRAFT_1028123 [Mycena floridula]|nr:hypothetical protein C8J56DRAFT_1028123 [Mycena floridula]